MAGDNLPARLIEVRETIRELRRELTENSHGLAIPDETESERRGPAEHLIFEGSILNSSGEPR